MDEVPFYLSRAFYAYVGLLERLLESAGLAQHLRPGMGPVLFDNDDVIIRDLVVRTGGWGPSSDPSHPAERKNCERAWAISWAA